MKSPGVPARRRSCRGTRARWHARLERGRARLPAARAAPVRRRHRHEGQDDHDASCSARSSARPAGRCAVGRQRRAPADGARAARGRVGRVRALVVPARGRARASRSRSPCCSTSSPTTSTATAPSRLPRRRSCASSSAPGTRGRAARLRAVRRARVEFAADDALPAEPRLPARTTARTPQRRRRPRGPPASTTTRSPQALAHVPGRPAPARARARARRRPLGERLDRDEHVRRAAAASPRTTRRCGSSSAAGPRARTSAVRARAAARTSRSVYLVGEAAEELAAALDAAGRPYERVGTVAAAVEAAARDAEPGDVVLLSPACASYDQYENFEERGDALPRGSWRSVAG